MQHDQTTLAGEVNRQCSGDLLFSGQVDESVRDIDRCWGKLSGGLHLLPLLLGCDFADDDGESLDMGSLDMALRIEKAG